MLQTGRILFLCFRSIWSHHSRVVPLAYAFHPLKHRACAFVGNNGRGNTESLNTKFCCRDDTDSRPADCLLLHFIVEYSPHELDTVFASRILLGQVQQLQTRLRFACCVGFGFVMIGIHSVLGNFVVLCRD